MKSILRTPLLLRLALFASATCIHFPVIAANKEVVAYFTSWGIYGRAYNVKNIVTSSSAEKLTVINYAFANVKPTVPSGQVVCQLGDEWADYQRAMWSGTDTVGGEFEDQETLCHKMRYVNKKKLRGVMFWELTGDSAEGELVSAINKGLGNKHKGCEDED